MPLKHTRSFRVRYYECDAYGHLNNANYLRYMQETAFDASMAAGYGLERYQQMGTVWLIRESEVEFLEPIRYGDTVEVTSWVIDFQRVRSRRAYEFRREGEKDVVAKGVTEWVYLDDKTVKPAPIPQELKQAFFPNGVAYEIPKRERFPEIAPLPPKPFRMRRRAAWNEVDPRVHVNNAAYMVYVEDAGVRVSEAFGWPMKRFEAFGSGWFASYIRIKHLSETLLGEELQVTTFLSNVKRASLERNYLIERVETGELAARALVRYAYADIESGRPQRMPQELLQDFAENISPGGNV